MVAGSSSAQRSRMPGRTYYWFQRNRYRLLAADIVCFALLFFMHLFTSTFQVSTPAIGAAIQVMAVALISFIALSVAWKGLVPLVVCILGLVLMYDSVVFPFYDPSQPPVISIATNKHFFFGLGAGMVALGMIIAYRPSVLFTKNRPESLDDEWSKYPMWQDNALLADGSTERSVPVRSLMTGQDRYLLWRYEYVIVVVSGTPHLVRPAGLVPKGSTLVRDAESGKLMGKPRYTGLFT